ncbi:N-lysine methyltransferase SETD6-like [Mizuhopecten yessoensis]|uniref:N-lysine methyltransferase n=1 Tax=Mizuhopecten yessoensis TaxID=6573 RepID=A0A210PGJ1_MIZYE|nr:N-lysine methyltransferase SETD6-like [Mizuhopecten yessoensis]OWF35599.1 N-lysine methyltransferase SETD6 [Mizuhopecten yessoensis]
MAAPAKRTCEDHSNVSSKISTVSRDETKLEDFLSWTSENKLWLSPKVAVSKQGSCAQYGMLTTDNVDSGECLFKVPRKLLLHPKTCAISRLLKKESAALVSESGWVPLLLALMYEYNNPESTWRPYLDLVPDFRELDLPMFWPESERASLLGSANGILKCVERDIKSLTSEFTTIVLPFVQKHTDVFGPACENVELYKKMVAFVMAYSFTEPVADDEDKEDAPSKSAPMMVPMADILNHVAHNNAELRFEKDFLKMVSTSKIAKGAEVFNTYGMLSNKDELHMYGFSERYPNNDKDTVDIPASVLKTTAENLEANQTDKTLLEEKWEFLMEQEVVGEDDAFVLSNESVETCDELETTLKVLEMTRGEFEEHQEKDGWSEDEGDEEEDGDEKWMFVPNGIPKLKETWKKLLKGCAEKCLALYDTSLEEDEECLASGLDKLSQRQKYVLYTDHGQKLILQKLLDSCS